jgi:hypothetical protein
MVVLEFIFSTREIGQSKLEKEMSTFMGTLNWKFLLNFYYNYKYRRSMGVRVGKM